MNILFKRGDGFTLVELMVVVAIVGLLSAVAVPNFKKYRAKSKIVEAKLQLSAIYTAETTFFSDYNMYAQCLRYLGFDPSKEINNRYYGVGFSGGAIGRDSNAHAAAVNSGLKASDCTDSYVMFADDGSTNTTWYPAGKGIGAAVIGDEADGYANAAGFEVDCTDTDLSPSGAVGTCVGSQEDAETMVFQAAAVGYISANFLTPATASGLNINHKKILKSAVNGY